MSTPSTSDCPDHRMQWLRSALAAILQCVLSLIWATPFTAGCRWNPLRCAGMCQPTSCHPSSTTHPMMCSALVLPSRRRSLMCASILPPVSHSLAATLTPKVGPTHALCRCDRELLRSTISSSWSIRHSRPLRNRFDLRSTCSSPRTMFWQTGTACTMASSSCAMQIIGALPAQGPAC